VYAVKVICKCSCDESEIETFEREVAIMKSAEHPSCIHLREAIATSSHVYIVMERMEGGELCERISSKSQYSETEAAQCFVQLLQAVCHLHRNGIVHRDIKPENIMYVQPEPDPRIKLVDFGLSRILDSNRDNVLKTICGTPCFVAPEVLVGDGYGQACDVWSSGGILYLLLCGYTAFEQDSAPLKFEAIRRCDYSFPEDTWTDVSAEATDLISKMMCLAVEQRFTAEEALQHRWILSYLSGELPKQRMAHMQRRLSEWRAARKLKGSVHACAAMHRMLHGIARPTPTDAVERLRKVKEDRGREAELREAFKLLLGKEEAEDAVVESESLSPRGLQRALSAAGLLHPSGSSDGTVRACLRRFSAWGAEEVTWDDFRIVMGPAPPRAEATPEEQRESRGREREDACEKEDETTTAEEARACFACLDRDKRGKLSAGELREALEALGENVTTDEAEEMVRLGSGSAAVSEEAGGVLDEASLAAVMQRRFLPPLDEPLNLQG